MRGSTENFTLRKAKVIKEITTGHYIAKDILNENEIHVSMLARMVISGMKLNQDEIIYVEVAKVDLTRGRLVIHGHRGGLEEYKAEKKLLDLDQDPMLDY